jgi:hypothetical protein
MQQGEGAGLSVCAGLKVWLGCCTKTAAATGGFGVACCACVAVRQCGCCRGDRRIVVRRFTGLSRCAPLQASP